MAVRDDDQGTQYQEQPTGTWAGQWLNHTHDSGEKLPWMLFLFSILHF